MGSRQAMRRVATSLARRASVVLAAVLLASCARKEPPEAGAVVTVDVAPVLLSQVQRTIRAEGLIYPRQQAAIVPKISAPIKKAYVQRGARGRAGQLLLELENQDRARGAAAGPGAFGQAERDV